MLAVLMTLFFLQVGSYGRLVGIGLTGLIAATVAGFPTLVGWIVVQLNYGGASSPIGSAAWGMISDIAWTMSLVDLVAFVCSTLLVAIGLLFAQLEQRANRQAMTRAQMAAQPVVELRASGGRPLDRLPKPPRPTN